MADIGVTLVLAVALALVLTGIPTGVYYIMESNARIGLYAIIAVIVLLLVVQVGAAMAFIAGRP